MKHPVREFIKRGLMAASGGPMIVAIIYKLLNMGGILDTLTADEVLLAVVTSALLAFFAAGASIVHQMEQLPRPIATLIHAAVLYVAYATVYGVNGWISTDQLLLFTGIFAAVYVATWLISFVSVRAHVARLNARLK